MLSVLVMTYLEMSKTLDDADETLGISTLDPISKEILKRVMYAEQENRTLMMKDFYDIACFQTIHNNLNVLIERGWVERVSLPKNKRIVLLAITPRAQQAIQSISTALTEKWKPICATPFVVLVYLSRLKETLSDIITF